MADAGEPRLLSLSDRIAALNKTQSERPYNSTPSSAIIATSTARRLPPPLPPTQQQRPLTDRSKSINNPPTSSFTVVKQYNNEPAGVKSVAILAPPPVDRDLPKPESRDTLSPQIKAKPPLLPQRNDTLAPQKTNGARLTPSLPPRKPSGSSQSDRRDSTESLRSISSNISALSMGTSGGSSTTSVESNTRKLPPTLDMSSLPSLPPTKRELAVQAQKEKEEKKTADETRRRSIQAHKMTSSTSQAANHVAASEAQPVSREPPTTSHNTATRKPGPNLPPRLPSRASAPATCINAKTPLAVNAKALPTTPVPALPQTAIRSTSIEVIDAPPPVPRSTRPTQAQIDASRSLAGSGSPHGGVYSNRAAVSGCLRCRDFREPDRVAALYPRHTLPADPTSYLADVLCTQFDSPTDKARAIFTWLHHNIDYDTERFFNKTVKGESPETSISRGLAVCGGYASIYSAIALKAGLECIMITGHGKGYGFGKLKARDPLPPPNPTGHAWNAVRIDNGEWKLIDACWGAGQLQDKTYNRNLADGCFTMSNEDFGLKHFPADPNQFFRADGRSLSWEEYIVGPFGVVDKPMVYGNVRDHGINSNSFMPIENNINCRASGPTHFQFSKICEHWDFLKNGKCPGRPYAMILQYNGYDGREKDYMPFEFDGTYWYLDIETRKLGCKPMSVSVYAVTTVNGKDARGWTKAQYLAAKGKSGMGFAGIAKWDLV